MFIVHYSDKKIEYEDGDKPEPRDVQVIVQPHPDIGWHTQSGYDYYVWREDQGRWVGVDLFGLFDFLLDTGLVLFGRTVTTDQFNKIMKGAVEDLGSAKSGWLRQERRI